MSMNNATTFQQIIDIVGTRDYRTEYCIGINDINIHYHRILVGKAVNLFKRMVELGATEEELKRAAEYALVCIDAMKYCLDYKKCRADNGIAALEKKYPIKKEG